MSPSSSFSNAWQRGPGEASSAVSDPGLTVWKGCPLGREEPWADQTAASRSLGEASQGPGCWAWLATPEPRANTKMSVLLDAHETILCFKQEDSKEKKKKRQFSVTQIQPKTERIWRGSGITTNYSKADLES